MSLLQEIDRCQSSITALWWLGHSGFAIRNRNCVFYVDPMLSQPGAPMAAEEIANADLILCSNLSAGHFDSLAIRKILERSEKAKLVLPKSSAAAARAAGIDYARMTTTDSGLRVEFFKGTDYGRIYSVPGAFAKDSEPPSLHWSAGGGFPHLCFLIRFAGCTIFHSGGTALYDELAERLKPYNVTIALLGIRESISGASQLAADIGARWLIPIESDSERLERFTEHMLGHRPEQCFKLMKPGEGWSLPEE